MQSTNMILLLVVILASLFPLKWAYDKLLTLFREVKKHNENEKLITENIVLAAYCHIKMTKRNDIYRAYAGIIIDRLDLNKRMEIELECPKDQESVKTQSLGQLYRLIKDIGDIYCLGGRVKIFLNKEVLKYVRHFDVKDNLLEREFVHKLIQLERSDVLISFHPLFYCEQSQRVKQMVEEAKDKG